MSLKTPFLRLLRFITNDKLYYRIRFFVKFKKFLNLDNPQTYNEKINYLKFFDRNPEYTQLVDKYAVRKYIEENIGKEYLIDLLGVYSDVSQIDFDALPDSFVFKGAHGSGWVIVCNNKNSFNVELARKEMDAWLKTNFYKLWGEWVYKDVPPRIVCERYLSDPQETAIIDYKFHCFNGEPQFVQVDLDRFENHVRNFYDLNWERMPFGLCYPQGKRDIKRPGCFDEMLKVVRILSKRFKLVRVDLYDVQGEVYFGELTFYPGNGLEIFDPAHYDIVIGRKLRLR